MSLGGSDRALRSFAAATGQRRLQFVAKALPGDAVQEEVDAVIQQRQKVGDRLGVPVDGGGSAFPVRLADEHDDARRDADQERERDTQAHERRLPEAGTGQRRSSSGSGRRGRGGRGGCISNLLRSDETANDSTVEEQYKDERQSVDQRERNPRSDVIQKVAVLRLRTADANKFAGLSVVLGSSRPELVNILGRRQEHDRCRCNHRPFPRTNSSLAERKADGYEPVKRERNQQPSGHVTGRVMENFIRATSPDVVLPGREHASHFKYFQPSREQKDNVSNRSEREIHSGSRVTKRFALQHDDRQNVTDDSSHEHKRHHENPDELVCVHELHVWDGLVGRQRRKF